MGRKTVFSFGVVLQSIVSISSVWYPYFSLIIVARFILGFCFPTTITTGFTLGKLSENICFLFVNLRFFDNFLIIFD